MVAHVVLDRALLEKYACTESCQGPYSPLMHLRKDFSEKAYRQAAQASNEDPIPRPLSVSLCLPASHDLDELNTCPGVDTARHTACINEYIGHFEREIALQAALFDKDRQIEHVHVNGDLSACMKYTQWERLFGVLTHHFSLAQGDQPTSTIDIRPDSASSGYIALLGELGFTHLNLIARTQTSFPGQGSGRFCVESLVPLIDAARQAQLQGVGITLTYGYPQQTLASFESDLAKLVALRPDQVSLYYHRFFDAENATTTLPLAHLQQAILHFKEAGYQHLGLGHFALAEDDLTVNWHRHTLRYDLGGYSPRRSCDLIGLGAGAFSRLDDSYSQNTLGLSHYFNHLDQGRLPVWRGYKLNFDDLLRREIVHQLLDRHRVEVKAIEERYHIVFRKYFASELVALTPFVEDGLVTLTTNAITLQPAGQVLLEPVSALFAPFRNKARQRLFRIV
ncbi:hypothetical protein [Halomonas sp. M20]|uniref:hypothetical protein n=1 Tax=Halomonas sp. M20 TaxID=2763264 RepID=UPI001D0ACFE7|nr:hypothetical protein [Halomonas sp. M20]